MLWFCEEKLYFSQWKHKRWQVKSFRIIASHATWFVFYCPCFALAKIEMQFLSLISVSICCWQNAVSVTFNWITRRPSTSIYAGFFLLTFCRTQFCSPRTGHIIKRLRKKLCLSFDVFHRYLIGHFLFPVLLPTDLKLACRVVYVISRASFAILRLEFGKQRRSFGEGVSGAGGSLKRSTRGVFIGGWRVWCPVMLVHFSLEPLHCPLPTRWVL